MAIQCVRVEAERENEVVFFVVLQTVEAVEDAVGGRAPPIYESSAESASVFGHEADCGTRSEDAVVRHTARTSCTQHILVHVCGSTARVSKDENNAFRTWPGEREFNCR